LRAEKSLLSIAAHDLAQLIVAAHKEHNNGRETLRVSALRVWRSPSKACAGASTAA
jgi:hypothetical protein